MEYTTFVNIGTERVKLTAVLRPDDSVELRWVERFVKGELVGCGPSLLGLSSNTAHECSSRLASLFEGTLLWRST